MKYLIGSLGVFTLTLFVLGVRAEEQGNKPNQRIELGTVHWQRDLDQAVAASQRNHKPIAMLFQEVPG